MGVMYNKIGGLPKEMERKLKAEAMLEALKNQGVEIEDGDYAEVCSAWVNKFGVRIPTRKHEFLGRGYLIFIPDEEQED